MHEQAWQGETARAGDASGESGVVAVLLPAGVPGAVRQPLAVVRAEAVIGREDDCDVVLESGRVSRRHARVWCREGRLGVEDLGSLNGTFVNRQRVVGSREIVDGDRLTLADVELQVRALPADSVARLPRPSSPAESRRPRGATEPMPPAYPLGGTSVATSYAQQREPERPGLGQDLSLGPLVLMLLASLSGAVAGQGLGGGPEAAVALAVATPLVVGTVALTTEGRPRFASVVVLTLVAALLTVAGVTAAELRLGRPILPWTTSGGTFVSATQIDRVVGRTGVPAGCGSSPTLALSPKRGPTRAPIRLSGHCFKAGEVVDVRLEGRTLASVRADDNGMVSAALALPPGTACPGGGCTLTVRGAQSLREHVARYVGTIDR
jgi:pSer/pThr/pTyr-binding forkhead associated (FHA) protein